jgi:signal transduction histidine kinase/CheY-like chemotaxis protein
MSNLRGLRPLVPLFTAFILLFLAAGCAVWLAGQQRAMTVLIQRTVEVENQLNRVQSLAIDAETGQRGFLLTSRDSYLEPYRTARQELLQQINVLAGLTAENVHQQAQIGELKEAAAAKLAELEKTVVLGSTGHRDQALAIVADDSGKLLMDRFRGIVSAMRVEGQRALSDRSAAAERLGGLAQTGLIATALLLVFVTILTLRDARGRLRALERSNHRLAGEIAERAAIEAQMRQLQKMEAVGQLTGGIAHDFNNMLAIIIGSLDVARRRMAGGNHASVARYIDNAIGGAERAAALVARLLAFSRRQPLEPKVLDCNKLVGSMSELLRRTLGENIRIETVLAGGLWRTRADVAQLESALLNLAVNARDSMPDGGRLTIETSNADLDDRYAAAHSEVTAGQYVMVSVTDTGTGMAAEIIEKAFEPYYTTKGVGKGSGLGLSQVFGFVKQSAGHVKIYSEVGHGSTLKIYLPRYAGSEAAQDLQSLAAAALPQGSSDEIVLVVEDEADVRHMSVDALRMLGYTVVQAATPAEALRQIEMQPAIKLLFTDIVMPEMSGRQLADRALLLRPELTVVYTTGYTRNAVVHNGVVDSGTLFLQKPFTVEQLALKIRQALDR